MSSTSPTNNAIDVAISSNVAVTFSEPVNAPATAFSISCASSGVHSFNLTGGPTTFTLDPNSDFVNSEVCTVTVDHTQVNDTDTNDPPDFMAADKVFQFTQGTITESSATVSSNGVFYGVITGVARPFRKPGVNISDPLCPERQQCRRRPRTS